MLDAQVCLPFTAAQSSGSLQLDSVSHVEERLVSQCDFQSLAAFLGPRKRVQGSMSLKRTVSMYSPSITPEDAGHRRQLAGGMVIIGCQLELTKTQKWRMHL